MTRSIQKYRNDTERRNYTRHDRKKNARKTPRALPPPNKKNERGGGGEGMKSRWGAV